MLRFDKALYLSFYLKSVSSVRLSNNLEGSDVWLFRIHKYTIDFCIVPFLNSLYYYTRF